VRDFGVSEETAVELMAAIYDPRCSPPWGEDGIREKVEHGYKYAENDIGAHRIEIDREFEDLGPLDETDGAANDNAPEDKPLTAKKHKWPGIINSRDFIAGFSPPDYLIEGIVQFRYAYSLTAPTGAGKTAIMLLVAASVGLERPIGGHEVARGRVLYLAGENPDDVRARWIAMGESMGFDPATIDVHFIPGVFDIDKLEATVCAEVNALGGVQLVIVDTSAAYFPGDNENDNKQMGDHARRFRRLTELPGGPCVIVCAHPTKNAGPDDLLPRGGGAFLNEVDGNLVARNEDGVVRLHWQGKFRGAEFKPVPFALATVTSDRLKSARGRLMPTVIGQAIDEHEEASRKAEARSDEDTVLNILAHRPGASYADIAKAAGWFTGKNGEPYKAKVQRAVKQLERDKLVEFKRGALTLTPAGKKEAKRIADEIAEEFPEAGGIVEAFPEGDDEESAA
jgi:hypothetical protein